MNFFDYKVETVWFTDKEIRVKLINGEEAGLDIEKFPLLKNATSKERENFEIIKGYAIHWPNLNEDLSIEGFFVSKYADI